jgi:hypothetical protein
MSDALVSITSVTKLYANTVNQLCNIYFLFNRKEYFMTKSHQEKPVI